MICFFAVVAIYGAISRYLDAREQKKAMTAEYFRRNALTPEARIAEDKARAAAAEKQKEESQKARIKQLGEITCLAEWKRSLKDPDSGIVTEFTGYVDGFGAFHGLIVGRAKNSFGAVVPRRTVCDVTPNGNPAVQLFESQS